MGIGDSIVLGAVFFKRPELSRAQFNERLGRWYITAERSKEIVRQMEKEGLIKVVKRNNQPFFQPLI